MKIKPGDKTGGVVMELAAKEKQLPIPEPRKVDAPLPVFRLKKILVPVDFSSGSRKALQYAVPFARQFGAELVLLHVIPITPNVPPMGMEPAMGMMPVAEESVEDVQKQLTELQWLVSEDVPATTLTRTGNPYFEIIGVARELGIDLIILSTHGRTGLEHMLLGSITEKVVRHSHCPVLIVREFERDFVTPELAESETNDQELNP